MVSADFANSGRLDLVFNHPFSKPTFYRNKLNDPKLNSNHWIGLQLEGNSKDCNRDALGTRVDLLVTEKDGKAWRMVQEVQLVSGLLSQSDRRLHFGLGEQVAKVSAKVTWCGRSEKWILLSDLAMDRYHSVREDQP